MSISALVTQDSFIAFQNFAIFISIDISIKTHQFVYIKPETLIKQA